MIRRLHMSAATFSHSLSESVTAESVTTKPYVRMWQWCSWVLMRETATPPCKPHPIDNKLDHGDVFVSETD